MGGNWRTSALLRKTSGPLVLTHAGQADSTWECRQPCCVE